MSKNINLKKHIVGKQKDYKTNLQVNFEKKFVFIDGTSPKDKDYTILITIILVCMMKMLKSISKQKIMEKTRIYVDGSLVNFQTCGEFNPPHDHDGNLLSFVIYLSIPEPLKKNNEEYKGRSCGPGGIQFMYGEGLRDCVSYQSYFPRKW